MSSRHSTRGKVLRRNLPLSVGRKNRILHRRISGMLLQNNFRLILWYRILSFSRLYWRISWLMLLKKGKLIEMDLSKYSSKLKVQQIKKNIDEGLLWGEGDQRNCFGMLLWANSYYVRICWGQFYELHTMSWSSIYPVVFV